MCHQNRGKFESVEVREIPKFPFPKSRNSPDFAEPAAKAAGNKEQIKFFKHKERGVQHNGFVYTNPKEVKDHPKWRCRMRCQRQINGKHSCNGYIWTTGKWDEDDGINFNSELS
ncbi:hypothetical protein Ddc_13450 [Ditylenchus destructor]|nr:hypothetical protein Ddc_13450 [Ditylenchus destructor]